MWRSLEKQRTLRFCILILVCRFDLSIGLPAEQPTRFTLNTGDTNSRNVAARVVSNYAPGEVSSFIVFLKEFHKEKPLTIFNIERVLHSLNKLLNYNLKYVHK